MNICQVRLFDTSIPKDYYSAKEHCNCPCLSLRFLRRTPRDPLAVAIEGRQTLAFFRSLRPTTTQNFCHREAVRPAMACLSSAQSARSSKYAMNA
jgi:hypothetical protein